MKPPEAPVAGITAEAADQPPAVSVRPQVLRKRSDFLSASHANRVAMPGFVLQARQRKPDEPATGWRVGYTCSKKVGNAVARNRAKRRLRELARLTLSLHARDGWDYVLVGRRDTTATLPFTQLQADLEKAILRIHGKGL